MIRVLPTLLLLFAVGCDGHTTLSGLVVDGNGKPIPDAQIKLTQDGHNVGIERTSDSDGAFHVGGCHEPIHNPLDLVVRKDGFKDDSRRVPPEHNDNMRIVMERDTQTDASTE